MKSAIATGDAPEFCRLRGVGNDIFSGRPHPPYAWVRPGNFAYGVWQAVATTLAEPLRKAFQDHLDACGCAERGGFGHCPEAMRLFELLPDGDRVIIG